MQTASRGSGSRSAVMAVVFGALAALAAGSSPPVLAAPVPIRSVAQAPADVPARATVAEEAGGEAIRDVGVPAPPSPPDPHSIAVDDATAARFVGRTPTVDELVGLGLDPAAMPRPPTSADASRPGAVGGAPAAAPSVPGDHRVFPEAVGVLQTWAPPASLGGKPLIGYLVEQASNASFNANLSFGTTGPTRSFQWSLPPVGTWHFRVRAVNADGFGPPTDAIAVTIPTGPKPGVPTSVKVRPLPGAVRATWSPPVPNGSPAVTGYLVRVLDQLGAVVALEVRGAGPTTVLLGDLPVWQNLFFYVTAFNGNGLGPSSGSSYFVPTESLAPPCVGTGSDGARVELIYAHAGAAPDPELISAATGFAARIDRMVSESAKDTGGVRHVRWRTTGGAPGCQVMITPVQVPSSLQTFAEVVTAVEAAGFDQPNRKYLTWVEDTSVTSYAQRCTADFLPPDDQPGQANAFNTTTMHAVCSLADSTGFGPAHELMHTFGAVQTSAPHSNGSAHCLQGYDPMCAVTGMVVDPACADEIVFVYKLDCGHDDYFNTSPLPGSYLCTNWNTARSAFLTNHLDETAPTAPLGLQATAGNGQVSLTWTAPTQQTCGGISQYVVTATPGGATVSTGSPSTVFPGLPNGVSHTFTVHAVSPTGTGPESAPSNAVTPSTSGASVPGVPTGVGALPRDGSALVSWTPPAADGGSPITGYRITVSPGGTFVTVGPGSSGTVPGLVNGTSYTFTVRAQNVVGLGPASVASTAVVPEVERTYHGVAPVRVWDSRPGTDNVGPFNTQWSPLGLRNIAIGGSTFGGTTVPADASAVVLNVTAVNPSTASFLTLWPTGEAQPTASNLNFSAGQVIPNLVVVKLGTFGRISVFNNSGFVHVIGDLVGYFDGGDSSGTRFSGVTPTRLLDSRPGPDNVGGFTTKWGAGTTRNLKVRDTVPVPAGATEVVLNMTVTGPSAESFLTVFPTGVTKPLASNLNFKAGQTIPNLVVAKIGATGFVSIYNNSGTVDVIADVVGYFAPAGASYTPIVPRRLIDSRPPPFGVGPYVSPWSAQGDRVVAVGVGAGESTSVPANASGVVLNVTAVTPTAESFLTVYPDGAAKPLASNLNFKAGAVIPNLVMVRLGTAGRIRIYNNSGAVDVIVDVVGFYR